MWEYMRIHMYTFRNVYIHVGMYVYIYMCVCMYIYIYIWVAIYLYSKMFLQGPLSKVVAFRAGLQV